MLSNLPPDFRDDVREHDIRCRTNCTSRLAATDEGMACAWGHSDHSCDCEALADWDGLEDGEWEAFEAWEKYNG